MAFKNGNTVWNEIIWTPAMIRFLRTNFKKMTNRQLSDSLGLKITSTRMKLYKMGLFRMRLNYWTDEQVTFLKKNYKKIGDLELSEMFNAKFKMRKKWTKKRIEKKRKYLKLKRTRRQIIDITQRNIDQGRLNIHMKGKTNWLTTGPARQKEIRMYRNCHGLIQARIKIGKRWVFWPRWAWISKYGQIKNGLVVVLKDRNPFNTKINNLELVTRAESTRRTAAASSKNLSDNYVAAQMAYNNPELKKAIKRHPELIETHRTVLLLKRNIKSIKYAQQQRSLRA